MQDNVSVLLATILAVILIVLFPIYNIAVRQDSMANNMVVKTTTNFVDEVRSKGYITDEDYNEYIAELGKTGNIYEVEMEIYEPILIETEDSEVYEEKYKIKYTSQILEEIGVEGDGLEVASENSIVRENVSYLNNDYKFYVRVKNTNMTQAQVLLGKLFGGESDSRIVVNYGGIVFSNGWEMGDNAEVTNANIFLSRPMDNNNVEYKREHIADVYNDLTEETEPIFGIAVRLNDDIPDSGIVKFILTYKEIIGFKDDSGAYLSNEDSDSGKASREQHIKKYVETLNFNAGSDNNNIEVTQISRVEISGTYNYEFEIKIEDIQYNYENNPYVKATIEIAEGSADTKAGEIGRVRSDEFIIFYDINRPILTVTTDPDVRTTLLQIIAPGANLTLKLDAIASLVSSVAKIDKLIIEFEKVGGPKTTTEIDATDSMRSGATVTFPTQERVLNKGKYNVIIYATDTRGHQSNRVELSFEIKNRIRTYKTFYLAPYEGYDGLSGTYLGKVTNESMNTIIAPKDGNKKIISYQLIVNLPDHTPGRNMRFEQVDYWRVTDITNGKNTIINPSNHSTVGLYDERELLGTYRAYLKCRDDDYYYKNFYDSCGSGYKRHSLLSMEHIESKYVANFPDSLSFNGGYEYYLDDRLNITKTEDGEEYKGIYNLVGPIYEDGDRGYNYTVISSTGIWDSDGIEFKTGTVDCSSQNIESLKFNYRIAPGHILKEPGNYTKTEYYGGRTYMEYKGYWARYAGGEGSTEQYYDTDDCDGGTIQAIVTYEEIY